MNRTGLNRNQLAIIKSVLGPYASRIDRVGVFGSRATGKSRSNSDIDMVLYGDLSPAEVDRIWTLFDSSDLAVKVDVNAYNLIAYPPLKRHIDEVMLPIFSKQDLQGSGDRG